MHFKHDHYRQQFQDVNTVSKLAENRAGERGVKVLPIEVAPCVGAACVRG